MVEAQQQLSALIGAVVDQGGKVVFAEPWFTADQHGTTIRVMGCLVDGAAQAAGVAAVSDNTAAHSPHHVRPQSQKLLVRFSQSRFRPE